MPPAALSFVIVVLCVRVADMSEPLPPCAIELECEECLPENMPLVTSRHDSGAGAGALRLAHGEEVTLACGAGGKFHAYPLRGTVVAVCEGGRYRVRHDDQLRHLLELGCQENVFEDVLHQVEGCNPPLQGRAYETQMSAADGGGAVRHLATLCFDPERAVAVRLRTTNGGALPLPPHSDRASPLTLFGNFKHMFDASTRHDAERLYSDDARLGRRLRALFAPERYAFAGETLTAARLLDPRYFGRQHARVAELVSNRAAVWRSVAEGNLRHLHGDVADFMERSRGVLELDVYAGTHGVLTLDAGGSRPEVFLKAGKRFPVPRYVWTVVHARRDGRATAVVVLNDPFVTVSELRAAVFCESACEAVSWLPRLRRNRNYERPLLGLVFCCTLQDFAGVVHEMPNLFNSTIQKLI